MITYQLSVQRAVKLPKNNGMILILGILREATVTGRIMALSSNIATLGIRGPVYEFGGYKHLVHSNHICFYTPFFFC